MEATKSAVASEAIPREGEVTTMKPETKTGIPIQKAETTVERKEGEPSTIAEDVRFAGPRAESKISDEDVAQQVAAIAVREKTAEEDLAAKMEKEGAAKLKESATSKYEIKKEISEEVARLAGIKKGPEYGEEEDESKAKRKEEAALPTSVSKEEELSFKKEPPYGEEEERKLREEKRLGAIKKEPPYGEEGERRLKPEGDLRQAPGVFKRTTEEAVSVLNPMDH